VLAQEAEQLLGEQKRQRRIIAEQNLTPEEIRRMTNDEDQLRKTISQLTDKLRDARKSLADLEVQVTLRSEEADDVLAAYEALLTQCHLHPPPPPDPVSHVTFEIVLDVAQSDPNKMVSGGDIRGMVRPAVMTYRSAKAQERVEYDAKVDDLGQALEKLQSETDDEMERLREHEDQRSAIEQSIETAKLVSPFAPVSFSKVPPASTELTLVL
jgi:kinetochore protein NDC80